jgi:hypothetical protein
MAKDDRLPLSPILVEDLDAVFGRNKWHGKLLSWVLLRFVRHLSFNAETHDGGPGQLQRSLGCGFALALIENSPVLLTRPLLETMPLHLWEITAQALNVRGILRAIEPLEHEGQILALGT